MNARRRNRVLQALASAGVGVAVALATVPCASAAEAVEVGARPQRRHVPTTGKQGRFTIPSDRVWPQQPGQADICLWEDDKLAAVSITIDDNCAPDHAWWIEQGERTGFRFTWFAVTGGLGGRKGTFQGTWDDFRKLKALGHDVQSHTVTHRKNDDERSDELVEAEYRDSKAAIEKEVGGPVVCMAYPWGKGKPALASQYFLACRGVLGIPNVANRINYMSTGTANIEPETVDLVLTGRHAKTKWMDKPEYKRGWLVPLYHYVRHGHTPDEKNASQARVKAQLDYLFTKREDLWVGLFRDVAFYGMQRDTARLEVVRSDEETIRFTLSDEMDDTLFAYPLTVKVRLPETWSAAHATQAGIAVDTEFVRHEDHPYARVKVVPDRGEVVLSAGVPQG